jgi:hypothetical protein
MLDQYPDGVAYELREILAGQASAREGLRHRPGIGHG